MGKSYIYVDGEFEARKEIKRSLFIATVKGEVDKEGAEEFVKSIKKRYPDATHNCYAYIYDALGNGTRFSDDGEPSGTAGQPILDVIKKKDIRMTAIVVTRYFGGIKLGAGGLVGAYSGVAAAAIANAKIAEKRECTRIDITVDYADLPAIESLSRKGGAAVESIEYGEGATVRVFVEEGEEKAFAQSVNEVTAGRAQIAITQVKQYKKLQ